MFFGVALISILLSAFLVLLARHYMKGDFSNLFKEPISLTLIALMLIHGLLPLFQYILGVYRYGDGYSLWSYVYAAFLTLLFAGTMSICYSLGFRSSEAGSADLLPMSDYGKIYFITVIVIPAVTGAFLFYMTIRGIGYSVFITDRITFTDRYGGLNSILYQGLYISFIVSVAGVMSSRGSDKSMMLLAMALGVITVAFFGYISSRHAVFIAFMAATGVYFVTTWKPRISFWNLVFSKQGMVLIGLAAGIVIIGSIRAEKSGLRSVPVARKIYNTLNESFGNGENVNWLIDNDFELKYGITYVGGFVMPFPRYLWPSKPTGAGPILKNFIRPGSYAIGKKGASSLTTGMVTEAYMNGGFIGVIIVGAITGFVIKAISRLRSKCYGTWSVAIYAYTTLIFAYSMTYGEFAGVYSRWLVDIFPLCIGFFLTEYRKDPYQIEYEYPEEIQGEA
jgi:hypothetical protein